MMSYWPRLILTNWEKQFLNLYANPDDNRRGPLRRFYPASLTLTETERLPIDIITISRRSRVFGISVSGDIEHFRIKISDSVGEQYTPDEIYIPHLCPGYTQIQPGLFGGVGQNPSPGGFSDVHILNPNIQLSPAQTLTISGFEVEPFDFGDAGENDYRVDFTFHVWEFPGMPGSPM